MVKLPVTPIDPMLLMLDKTIPIVKLYADFSCLPCFDGDRYTTPDVPNNSEEIDSQPTQSHDSYGEPGVELHPWIPESRTMRRRGSEGKIQFASAPIRLPVTSSWEEIVKDQTP